MNSTTYVNIKTPLKTSKIRSSTWIKLNCALTAIVAILLLLSPLQKEKRDAGVKYKDLKPVEFNACCGFPCQNGGVCVSEDTTYSCDCTDTGYFGKNCHKATVLQWLKSWIKFKPTKAHWSGTSSLIWRTINALPLFKTTFNKNLYRTAAVWGNSYYRWTTSVDFSLIDSYVNFTASARSLPPIPKLCPTPMGVRGPKQLPSARLLYDKLFRRTHFKACPKKTNLLFATYIQHFASQFDSYEEINSKQLQWANNLIDMSHIYGKLEQTRTLRSFIRGKLKSRYYQDEEYPPYLEDCAGIIMIYPKSPYKAYLLNMMQKKTVHPKWALGNPGLSMTPMLFALSTIWLREHNRICYILANEHTHWNDEQIYQTAKHIVTGIAIKITLTEYMKHLMQSRMDVLYKPELTTVLDMHYTGNLPKEFSVLPHWQSLMPEQLTIESHTYNMSDILFTNNFLVYHHGLEQLIHAMATEPAGKVGPNNIGNSFECCIKHIIDVSRALQVQSYNSYRRRFGLKPAKTFEEITGNLHSAAALNDLYLDVEAVELIVGLLMEQQGSGVFPPTMTAISGAWLIRGLLSHPINSPDWWKPSTFGGKIGMNIIKSASLKKLICLNMKNKCHNIYVGFVVPRGAQNSSRQLT